MLEKLPGVLEEIILNVSKLKFYNVRMSSQVSLFKNHTHLNFI